MGQNKMNEDINQKIKVIITGATGMVGEGVLHECLLHPAVEAVLAISRKPCGVVHPKLQEIIVKDLFDLSGIKAQLTGYNACFFCLGTTSIGKLPEEYYKITYSLTLNFAQTLSRLNTNMTFIYVSGAGTDSSEKGRAAWARVKGKTENDLQKLGFKNTYLFRPGMLKPAEGAKNILPSYKWFKWLIPVFEKLFPGSVCTLAQLGQAMIHVVTRGYTKNIIEVKDIKNLSI